MGNYLSATQVTDKMGDDLVAEFLALSGDALTAEINRIITHAETLMHGYIEERYSTPITADDCQQMLSDWAYAIVQYQIYERSQGPEVQERVRQQYLDAIYQLKDVQKGAIILPGTSAAITETSFASESNAVLFDWDDDAEGTF